MMSIGYGDVYPGSLGGRIMIIFCGVAGAFIIATLINIVEEL